MSVSENSQKHSYEAFNMSRIVFELANQRKINEYHEEINFRQLMTCQKHSLKASLVRDRRPDAITTGNELSTLTKSIPLFKASVLSAAREYCDHDKVEADT